MKNKLYKSIMLLTVCVISLMMLFSCKIKNTDSDKDKNHSNGNEESRTVGILYEYDEIHFPSEFVIDILYGLSDKFPTTPEMSNDSSKSYEYEVIIGEFDRELSKQAYRYLSRVEKENPDDECAYLIYSDGTSVAIAYEKDDFGIKAAAISALDYYYENYVLGNAELRSGILYKGYIDPIAYQRNVDYAERAEEFDKLAEAAGGGERGAAIADALKEYYSKLSPDVITWLANLYEVETGAFYFSNSGRNNFGFGPDAESTYQAFRFLAETGALDPIGGKISNLPKEMKQNLINWLKPMQDPNGYFYHPQWTKAMVDARISRRGRDLSRATSLLSSVGALPTYNTPSGTKGDYKLIDGTKVDSKGNPIATSLLTEPLSDNSIVHAVSKVTAVSTVKAVAYASYLQDGEAFKDFLASQNIKTGSYKVGNDIVSIAPEIKARDKELRDIGANYSLVQILEDWFNENQNPKNGTWYYVDPSSPDYDVYYAVNGLLKISTAYNTLGMEFKYPLEAIQMAIDAIYTEDTPLTVCYTYNAWFSICNIFDNMRIHWADKAAADAEISKIRGKLLDDAPNLIRTTLKKVMLFGNPDGSFTYDISGIQQGTSQSIPVCVGGTEEGDVNGTLINGYETHMFMLKALGLPEPKLYGPAEYYTFMRIVNDLGPIIKDELEYDEEPITFDDDMVGEAPPELDVKYLRSEGRFVVEEDPRADREGNIFGLRSVKGASDSLYINCPNLLRGLSCYIFEGEFMVESGDANYDLQICLSRCYMLGIRIDGDKVNLFDASSQKQGCLINDYGLRFDLGEWFKVRVEYFTGSADSVRIKLYVNDKLIAISDNYYDHDNLKLSGKESEPSSDYDSVQIIAMSDRNISLLMDNLVLAKSFDRYKPVKDELNGFNVDYQNEEEIIYDFNETDTLPEDITTSGDGIEVTDDGKLTINGADKNSYVRIPVNVRDAVGKCDIFEADISLNEAEIGTDIELAFREVFASNANLIRLRFKVVNEGGQSYLVLCEGSGGILGAQIARVALVGDSFKLKIKFYNNEGAALIYVNDKLISICDKTDNGYKLKRVGSIVIKSLASDKTYEIKLDNLKAERVVSSYSEDTKIKIDRITNSFNDGYGTVTPGMNAEILTDGDNKLLSLGNEGSFTISLNKRSDVISVYDLGMTLFAKYFRDGNLKIEFKNSEGTVVIAYEVRRNNERIEIYELTARGVYEDPICSVEMSGNADLLIEYRPDRNETYLYIYGTPLAISSLTYLPDTRSDIAYAEVTAYTSDKAAVDNLFFDGYNKRYEKVNAVQMPNTDADDGVIDFESSFDNALPSHVNSSGMTTKPKITESLTESGTTKALLFKTVSGKFDIVRFDVTKDEEGHTAVIAQTDMKISFSGDADKCFEFYFTDNNDGVAYMLVVKQENGKFYLYDVTSSKSYGTRKQINISENEWFNIRVEFYYATESTKATILTYINDRLVYESLNYYTKASGDPNPIENGFITRFRFNTWTATDATAYFDNVSVSRIVKALPDTSPQVHTFEDSKTGDLPLGVSNTRGNPAVGSELRVDAIEADGAVNKVLAFITRSGSYDTLTFTKTKNDAIDANATVFETNISIDFLTMHSENVLEFDFKHGSNYASRLFIYSGGLSLVSYGQSESKVKTDVMNLGVAEGKWFNLRIEFIYGDNSTTLICVYVNDVLRLRTNIYYKYGAADAPTLGSVNSMMIASFTKADADVYFDNVSLANLYVDLEKIPAEPEIPEPEPGSEIINYDNGSAGSVSASQTITIVDAERDGADAGNKVLEYNKSSATYTEIYVTNSGKDLKDTNAYIFESYMNLDFADTCTKYSQGIDICFINSSSSKTYYVRPYIWYNGNSLMMSFQNASNGEALRFDLGVDEGEWFKIRIELRYLGEYTSAPEVKVYVNESLIASGIYRISIPEGTEEPIINKVVMCTSSSMNVHIMLDDTSLYNGKAKE